MEKAELGDSKFFCLGNYSSLSSIFTVSIGNVPWLREVGTRFPFNPGKIFSNFKFLDDSGEFISFKAVNLKRNRSKKLCLPLGDSFSGKSLPHHSNSLSKSILTLKR